jgi:hypothetical protein
LTKDLSVNLNKLNVSNDLYKIYSIDAINYLNNNKEYFDNWESQLKGLPVWNIVEVERFI